jgi:hypothetical protein
MLSIFEDFEVHKKVLLDLLRETYTPQYFNTFARLAPQMLTDDAPEFDDLSDAEAAGLVGRLRQALAVSSSPRNALAELDGLLAKDPSEFAARAG